MNSPYAGEKNGNYRHGGNTINRAEYNSWRAMRERCYNTNYRRYDRYGARGIKVCERWNDGLTGFVAFLEDMGKKPTPKHTIDRINNNGDYEPGNCRWANQREQLANSSRVKLYTIDGIEARMPEHAMRYNLSTSAVYSRMGRGMSPEEAVKTPNYFTVRKQKALEKFTNCLSCGKKCNFNYTKYCSNKCGAVHRKRDSKNRFVSTH